MLHTFATHCAPGNLSCLAHSINATLFSGTLAAPLAVFAGFIATAFAVTILQHFTRG